MRTERLRALADGVFAIALTLLVLGLPTPRGSSRLAADRLEPAFVTRLPGAIRRSIVGPVVYTAVALASAPVAFVLFAAVAVFFWASGRAGARAPDTATAPPE